MTKYKVVMCCYDKILVNVATYVIPVYICGPIYQDFIITTHYYFVFRHLMIHDFS